MGKKKTKTPEKPSRPRLLFRPKALVPLAVLVLAAFCSPVVVRHLPDLRQRDEYTLSTTEIEITPPPRWVPADLVDQVVQQANLPETVSLLEDDLAGRILEAFEGHPWVAEVRSVRKSMPARLTVELRYREPVAMVQMKAGFYPVDKKGTLLPPQDFAISEAKRYPRITNVQSVPQGSAGTAWGDVVVLGAARIAEALAPHWEEFELAAIRAPRPTSAHTTIDDLTYVLITRGGSRILWGRAPGADHPGELTAEQKVGRLQEYLARFEQFDRPHGPYEIDIRHWREISRRPLSMDDETTKR